MDRMMREALMYQRARACGRMRVEARKGPCSDATVLALARLVEALDGAWAAASSAEAFLTTKEHTDG